MSPASEPAPVVTRRAWAGLTIASISYVLILDGTAVAVAFADLEESFPDTARTTLAWVSTAFTVSIAASMLIAGRLADRFGWRRMFVLGMWIYSLGGLAAGAAPGPAALIAARTLQGASAALFTVTAFPLALPAFPDSKRGSAIGWIGVAGALSALGGPVIGGNLVDLTGWRGVMMLGVPFCAIAALGARATLDERRGDRSPIEPLGVLVGALGLAALALLILQRWLVMAPVAVALITLFVWRDGRSASPLVRRELFGDRHYTTALISQLWTQVAIFAFFFSTPLFLVNVWGWTIPAAGWALAIPMIVSLNSVPTGRYADRHGYQGVLIAGGLCAAAGIALWVAVLDTTEHVVWLGVGLVLFGWGAGMVGITGLGAALNAVADERLTDANAVLQTGRRLVQGIGAAIALAILGNRDATSLTSFRWVWAVVAGGYAMSAVAMLFYRAPNRFERSDQPMVFAVLAD